MTGLERAVWADRRTRGVGYTAVGVAIGWSAGRLVDSTATTVALVVAGRELRRVAATVGGHLLSDDLAGARAALPSLVGRDPSTLDESGVAAAVIESVAENAVDAVVAPTFWAVVAGAPGAAAYRAINTMDAMVGHRGERYGRFGWASARLDDVANWIPARLYAAMVAIVGPADAGTVRSVVLRDANAHPSPNAGVAEAAMAAALGRELGGPLRYGERFEDRPALGDGPRPMPSDIDRALTAALGVENALLLVLTGVWLATGRGSRRRG